MSILLLLLVFMCTSVQLGLSEDANRTLCDICQCPSVTYVTKNTLNCRFKMLKSIPAWDLSVLQDEVELFVDFNFNNLTSITKDMMAPRSDVYVLTFESNDISYIGPQTFCNFPSLRTLSLSSNSLKIIDKQAFLGCDHYGLNLTTLDLSLNQLHSLDDDLFDDLQQLRKLFLSENEFVAIDTSTALALNKLIHLTHLDLSRNKIYELSSGLSTPIKTLDYLNLAGNKLEQVPDVLQYGKMLTDLCLDENPIMMITDLSFKGLGKLQVLNMSYMPELQLFKERSLQPLISLKNLRCNHNAQLKYIHQDVFGSNHPDNLEIIDMSENGIETLDAAVFSWWKGTNLNLQGNPFYCDCDLLWLKQKNVNPDLMLDVKCVTGPPNLQGQPLTEVNDKYLLCRSPGSPSHLANFGVAMAIVATALLTVLVAIVIVMGFWRWRTGTGPWTSNKIRYIKAPTTDD